MNIDISLSQSFDILEFKRSDISAFISGGSFSAITMDVDPMEFLQQAERDFESEHIGKELNCITNAKRAIVCQMDQILLSLGYGSTRWNIPKKIKKIKDLGIIAPRILSKVSKVRNQLEHEYLKPSSTEIEESLDIAALFVHYSQKVISPFEHEITFFDSGKKDFTKFGEPNQSIQLGLTRNESNEVCYLGYVRNEINDKCLGYVKIYPNSKLFDALVGLARSLSYSHQENADDKISNVVNLAYGAP